MYQWLNGRIDYLLKLNHYDGPQCAYTTHAAIYYFFVEK